MQRKKRRPRTARRPTNTSRLRVNADSARLGLGALGSYLGVILACTHVHHEFSYRCDGRNRLHAATCRPWSYRRWKLR